MNYALLFGTAFVRRYATTKSYWRCKMPIIRKVRQLISKAVSSLAMLPLRVKTVTLYIQLNDASVSGNTKLAEQLIHKLHTMRKT